MRKWSHFKNKNKFFDGRQREIPDCKCWTVDNAKKLSPILSMYNRLSYAYRPVI